MHRLLLLSLCLLAALAARAWRPPVSDLELLGRADLVAVATVTAVDPADDPHRRAAYTAALRLDRVLKGPAQTTALLRYVFQPKYQDNDPDGITLAVGQRALVFLQRARDGYGPVVDDARALRAPEEAAAFATLLDALPAQTALQLPAPALHFQQTVKVAVTVKNTGATPIIATLESLQGFYYSPRIDTPPAFTLVQPARPGVIMLDAAAPVVEIGPHVRSAPLEAIPPGAERTLTADAICQMPPAWQFLGPESYVLTPAALRALVRIQPQAAGADPPAACLLATAWAEVLLGFPPPAP